MAVSYSVVDDSVTLLIEETDVKNNHDSNGIAAFLKKVLLKEISAMMIVLYF